MSNLTVDQIRPTNNGTTNFNERTYTLEELNRAIDIARNPPQAVTEYVNTVDSRSRARATRRVIRNLAINQAV